MLGQGGRGDEETREPVPTLREFWPRFMEGYARAVTARRTTSGGADRPG